MKIDTIIKGRRPLLISRFPSEDAITPGPNPGKKIKKALTPDEECQKKLYLCPKTQKPYIPAGNILACIRDAGRHHKIGKKQVSTRDSSMIPIYVQVFAEDGSDCIPIISEGGWSVDARPVCNKTTNGRFISNRPCFHDWELRFIIELEEEEFSPDLLYDILVTGSKYCGLCAFTPAHGGPFGLFSVVKFGENRKRIKIDKSGVLV